MSADQTKKDFCRRLQQTFNIVENALESVNRALEKNSVIDFELQNWLLDNMEVLLKEFLPQKELTVEQKELLIATLKDRFYAHQYRHDSGTQIYWVDVSHHLSFKATPEKLWSLYQMEITGGEPDVVDYNRDRVEYKFEDRSKETPRGRRNCVYDKEAEEEQKRVHPEFPCKGNAVDLAAKMGADLLTEEEYREAKLQEINQLDKNSLSWIKTPPDVRSKGFAIRSHMRSGSPWGEGFPRDKVYNNQSDGGFRCSLWL